MTSMMEKKAQAPEDGRELTIAALKDEVELTAYRASGPGGQHKNKTESAIRLTHLPTGITVIAREHRSQIKNRALAWERLIQKLEARRRKRKPRIPTRTPRAVKEQRLKAKAAMAVKKSKRSKPRAWEET